ncbi:MAG: DUF2203 domain-containing protein [Acidobacteriota bacterium]|nr:DUF2203 domain-containing protein [Acidobacteriota bacterium]
MPKTFTLAEAQMLLPVIEALLLRARRAAARIAALEAAMQALQHRIFLTGGAHVDIAAAARRHTERDKAAQEAKDVTAEIEAIGVRIHDLEAGLLDLPALAEGRTVLLCWQLGEPAILHWHTPGETADQRRPVHLLFHNDQPDRPH